MKAFLAPSLLSANFANLEEECKRLEKAQIPWLHLDVMDGSFVPNITFGVPVIAALRKISTLFLDVHLMIDEPGRYITEFTKAGADMLVPHLEAMTHPQRVIAAIREQGLKAGIALNPDTDPSALKWLLPWLDLILIMGVNPGFSGQQFLPQTVEKVKACREFISEQGYGRIAIEVDGGASPQNACKLVEAGANILVSGSAFFGGGDYNMAAARFEAAMEPSQLDTYTSSALIALKNWNGEAKTEKT